MEDKILMKWRKNLGFAIFALVVLPSWFVVLLFMYFERKHLLLLVISFAIFALMIVLLVTSFNGWNEYLYMDEEKIWIKRKDILTIWRFDEVTECRIIRRPRWSSRSYYGISIATCSNPKPLIFEWNDKVEKKLLEITKGKDVWKIFREAFK